MRASRLKANLFYTCLLCFIAYFVFDVFFNNLVATGKYETGIVESIKHKYSNPKYQIRNKKTLFIRLDNKGSIIKEVSIGFDVKSGDYIELREYQTLITKSKRYKITKIRH